MTTPYASVLLEHPPDLYYPMDDFAGATVLDASGNGHHATVEGAPLFREPTLMQAGQGGPSMFFHGEPGTGNGSPSGFDRLVIPSSFVVPAGSPITIAFLNHTPGLDRFRMSAFNLGRVTTPNRCQAHVPDNSTEAHLLCWDYGNIDPPVNARVKFSYDPWLNNPVHLALIADPAAPFHGAMLDGVFHDANASPSTPVVDLVGGDVGFFVNATGAGTTYWWHYGWMSDFAVWIDAVPLEFLHELASAAFPNRFWRIGAMRA